MALSQVTIYRSNHLVQPFYYNGTYTQRRSWLRDVSQWKSEAAGRHVSGIGSCKSILEGFRENCRAKSHQKLRPKKREVLLLMRMEPPYLFICS